MKQTGRKMETTSPQMSSSSSNSDLVSTRRSDDRSGGGAPKTVPEIPLTEEIAESSNGITTESSLVSTDSIVGAGGGGDLDLDASSKKALDDLEEIVFSLLVGGIAGRGGERELQGLIFRRKVNISTITLLLVVVLLALAWSFMEEECSFPPHLTPT